MNEKENDWKFRVTGPNSVNGDIEEWAFPGLEFAQRFAQVAARGTNAPYRIYEYIGTVQQKAPEPPPLECLGGLTLIDDTPKATEKTK